MSTIEVKAHIPASTIKGPLMTQSGHRTAVGALPF
jgi:hypothetical protein